MARFVFNRRGRKGSCHVSQGSFKGSVAESVMRLFERYGFVPVPRRQLSLPQREPVQVSGSRDRHMMGLLRASSGHGTGFLPCSLLSQSPFPALESPGPRQASSPLPALHRRPALSDLLNVRSPVFQQGFQRKPWRRPTFPRKNTQYHGR